jgi:choline dehydrogenase-like flavoprotein
MPDNTSGGWHHMGTTRMSQDSRKGVVDANCKVHGIENLFVAGSSCFPNGGAVNPTLTLVALSIRLSDHIKKIAAG